VAWAICFTPEDFDELKADFRESGLTGGERNTLRRYVTGGFDGWDTAAMIPVEHPCWESDGATMRCVVLNQGSRAEFLGMVATLAQKYPDRAQLRQYHELLSKPWVAVDPWPPPEGYFGGMTCT
jgi:hypothetical protein